MKTQIKFQKILSLATLIVAAVAFIFSICFFSGNLSDLMWYKGEDQMGNFTVADEFLLPAQDIMNAFVYICIVFFVVIAFIYITSTNSRRNYYVSNYVIIGAVVLYALLEAFYCLISMAILMGLFNGLDWSAIDAYQVANAATGAPVVAQSNLMFILGIVVSVIVLIDALAWIYNLIWKIKLMKGEKKLLANSFVKEVA